MKLHEYIQSKLSVPFEYGVNDCMLFTVGWVELSTGEKYLPAKLWQNKKQADAKLKKMGGIEKIFDAHFERIHPNFAVDGDLTLLNGVACLFSGAHCVSTGTMGLSFQSRLAATVAWRTPCRK